MLTPAAWAQPSSSTPASLSAHYSYITIDYPGAIETYPLGMNSHRQIAGYYVDSKGPHAFIYESGKFTPIDYPGALATTAGGINDRGDVAGLYVGIDGYQHGYLWARPDGCEDCARTFRSLDVPGAAQTNNIDFEFGPGLGTGAAGIDNADQVVGIYATNGLYSNGFIYTRGHYETVDNPNADHTKALGTKLFSINNEGAAAGDYMTQANAMAPPITHGFIYQEGKYTPVFVPGSDAGGFGTQVNGINDEKVVVGVYSDPQGRGHALLWAQGRAFTVDYPGQPFNEAHSINNRGDITGAYINDPHGYPVHGFLAVRKDR
jgi:hypothetical protein